MAFSPEVERTTCPVCGHVKEARHLVCHTCNRIPANVEVVRTALARIKVNPPKEIWEELVSAVEAILTSGANERGVFEVLKTRSSERISFLPEGTVIKAVRVVKEKRDRLTEAAKFLRQYLKNGGEFSPMPVRLASNVVRDTPGGGFTHQLLTVAADRVVIPEEKERVKRALAREMDERAKADSANTLRNIARFTASPETKAAARRRENSSAVPAMATA
jgi:hypothetical protein